MDFTLLFAAKAACKNPAKYWRIAVAAALGACFAVAYPLFGVGGAWGIIIKVAAGLLMCAAAGKFQSFKGYLKFSAVFLAATFVLGGALVALFSVAGISYQQGGGFILSSVPVGIPAFFALILAIAARRLAKKLRGVKAGKYACTVYYKGRRAQCAAFYDSGNNVYISGAPVSIVPERVAKKLIGDGRIKTYTDIHTVAGKSKIAVFTSDRIEIDDGKTKVTFKGAALGISPQRINKIILHCDLTEVN